MRGLGRRQSGRCPESPIGAPWGLTAEQHLPATHFADPSDQCAPCVLPGHGQAPVSGLGVLPLVVLLGAHSCAHVWHGGGVWSESPVFRTYPHWR